MVVEVSSHALYQSRLWPVKFDGVAITNLTREHLDFHWTMEHYCKTKFQLFRDYITDNAVGIMPHNFEFEAFVQPMIKTKELLCFGYEDVCDVSVSAMHEHPELEFTMRYKDYTSTIHTKIVGSFNAENMMIAATLAEHA